MMKSVIDFYLCLNPIFRVHFHRNGKPRKKDPLRSVHPKVKNGKKT